MSIRMLRAALVHTTGIRFAKALAFGSVSYLVFTIAAHAQSTGTSSNAAQPGALPPVTVQQPARKRAATALPSGRSQASRTASRSRAGRQASAPPAPSANRQGTTPSQTPMPGLVADSGSAATKTSTPLMQTPGSISVVTHQQIIDQNAQSVAEALRYTPGVVPE
jgi:iron complex outermembrane receptor protein